MRWNCHLSKSIVSEGVSLNMNPDRFAVTEQRNKLFWATLMVILLAFFLWQVNHLDGFRWDFDEGVYMMDARLIRAGYRLYSDIFSAHPPLFVQSIAWAFAVLDTSTQVARAVVVVYSTIGLLAAALIARELGGPLAGLGTALLLAITPDFFLYSRVCIQDLPAISMAALALLWSLLYWRSGQRVWLLLSGFSLAIGLLLKLLVLFAVPVLAISVVLCPPHSSSSLRGDFQDTGPWRRTFAALLWWGGALVVPILLCVAFYEARPMVEQTLLFHWQARDAFEWDALYNLRRITRYVIEDRGLFVLAFYGMIVLLIRWVRRSVPLILWFLCAALMLVNRAPLWPHLLTPFLLPLSICAGLAVEHIFHMLNAARKTRKWRDMAGATVSLCVPIAYLLYLPDLVRADANYLAAPQSPIESFIPRFLQAVSGPDDFVITDEPLVAFWADRNVPPLLTDTSHVRMRTGVLTAEQLVSLTEKYDPPAIVFWSSDRFVDNVPEYVHWVNERYPRVERFGKRRKVYLRFRPSVASDLSFGGKLMLMGYDLALNRLESDGQLDVTLYWQDLEPVGENYEVVLKLLNGAYKVWGREEGPPVDGLLPTGVWQKGELVVDRHTIGTLPGTPPGDYWIEIALYGTFGGRWLDPDLGCSTLLGPVTLPSQRWSPQALDIEQRMETDLGDTTNLTRLLGYNIESSFRPGDNIHLTLFWQCLEEMEQSYTVFTHLIDEKQNIWGQKDNPPVDGFYPTTKWKVGEIVRDQYDLVISSDAPSGEYRLNVGMYLAETGERLNVLKDGVPLPDTWIPLQPVAVGDVE
jgi:4-amino-4-deoxy-L-arabinose transferase-like glycosyltransferase